MTGAAGLLIAATLIAPLVMQKTSRAAPCPKARSNEGDAETSGGKLVCWPYTRSFTKLNACG